MNRALIGLGITMVALVLAGCPNAASAVVPSASMVTMVTVPAGRFQRDATEDNISVITQPFRMSAYEITRAQWRAIFGEDNDPSDETSFTELDDPVRKVNWYHAIAFANKLSITEGLTPVYNVSDVNFNTLTYGQIPTVDTEEWNNATANWSADGYRLPTEMEWMWAAMGAPADGQGGEANTTGYVKFFSGFTGSNDIKDYVVYSDNSGPGGTGAETRTAWPVGSKLPNELGLYDMSGNVGEWIWDWHTTYPPGELTNYRGADSGSQRVLRGGSFTTTASALRLDIRPSNLPHSEGRTYGFRVVRR